jgi:hypothetical protein
LAQEFPFGNIIAPLIKNAFGENGMKQRVGFLMLVGCVTLMTGCDPSGQPQNYQFFKDNPDQAKSVIGDCRLNGTRGMDPKRSAVCEAAVAAEKSTKYEDTVKTN